MRIEFRIDPADQVAETVESNNSLVVGSHDLTLSIWVEQGLYDIFDATPNLTGSRSFEDWIQAQFATMNERFRLAVYPVSPHGILDRVKIEKIVVAPELDGQFPFLGPCVPDPVDPDRDLIDGRWSFTDGDPTNAEGESGEWQEYVDGFATIIDWGLIHELGHQLGLIDLYRMNLLNAPESNNGIDVRELNGQIIAASSLPTFGFDQLLFQYPGIMVGGDTSPYRDPTYFESHSAGGMNSHDHRRRGFFGEYLFDTPKKNILTVVDPSGNPLARARVELFQKDAISEHFDDTPEIVGTTNQKGRLRLPARSVAVPLKTATGHRLRPNPFGQIFHEGPNGTMLVRAILETPEGPQERYGWLFITDLNLAYWEGHRDRGRYSVVVHPPPAKDLPGRPGP